jgi:hypothetical protein
MGSRERKRQERRKRKRRSATRSVEGNGAQPAEAAPAVPAPVGEESFQERMARRSEERNEAARAKLKPLERGERPTAVTVAAVVSTILTVLITVQAGLAIANVDAGGADIHPAPLLVFGSVLWVMTIGLWRARYWGVLGFQTLLLLVLLASAVGLVQVSTVLQAVGTTTLLIASGLLFYFMIRAMARIQMPTPPGAE